MERVPCEPNPDCKFYAQGECYKNVHHIWWPKNQYRGETARTFRNLPENLIRLCRAEHDELHATTLPPEVPSHGVMKAAIERVRNDREGRLE